MKVSVDPQALIPKRVAYYLLMSLSSALVGGSLFTYIWLRLNAGADVLFFFFGLPLIVGASFILIITIFQQLFQRRSPRYAFRRAGLLAAALAGVLMVSLPRLTYLIILPETLAAFIGSWMVVIIWAIALLISSVLFPAIL